MFGLRKLTHQKRVSNLNKQALGFFVNTRCAEETLCSSDFFLAQSTQKCFHAQFSNSKKRIHSQCTVLRTTYL